MKFYIQTINGWLLVVIAMIILVVYHLVSKGMFLDGLTYASISENFSGFDSFWELHYTETLKPDFYEHPPLAFWLQSLFIKNGFDENFYSLFMLIVVSILVGRIYILYNGAKELSWLPALFFVITPVVFWSFSNNMLENTLTAFTLLTVYAQLFILEKELRFYYSILPGLLTICCFLVKGPVGLFPMIIIPLHWFFFNERGSSKKYLQHSFYYLAGIVLFSLVLFINPSSRDFLSHYFSEQVLASITGEREKVISHFFVLWKLILELLLMFATAVLLFFLTKHKLEKRKFYFFLTIGFSASLPIMLSAKQMGFYIVPAIPFFAVACAFLVSSRISSYFSSIFTSLILGVGFIFISYHTLKLGLENSRDETQLEVVHFFEDEYYQDEIISISSKLKEDWALHAYLYRYCKISMDDKKELEYLIIPVNDSVPKNYILIFENKNYKICNRGGHRK